MLVKIHFNELNLIKTTWLLFGCFYHRIQCDNNFLEELEYALDKHSQHYEKFFLLGNFSMLKNHLLELLFK